MPDLLKDGVFANRVVSFETLGSELEALQLGKGLPGRGILRQWAGHELHRAELWKLDERLFQFATTKGMNAAELTGAHEGERGRRENGEVDVGEVRERFPVFLATRGHLEIDPREPVAIADLMREHEVRGEIEGLEIWKIEEKVELRVLF